jgi:hypothetical protein
MNRPYLSAFAIPAVALSMGFASHAEANNCDPPVGVSDAFTWGSNGSGQLGDGTTTDRYEPVQVQNLSGIQAIAGGGAHSLALKNDCTVWAWGENFEGQLEDGTTDDRSTPAQVNNLSGVIAWRSRLTAQSGRGVRTSLASWVMGPTTTGLRRYRYRI